MHRPGVVDRAIRLIGSGVIGPGDVAAQRRRLYASRLMVEGFGKARSARALAALSVAAALTGTGTGAAQAVPSGHGAAGRSCGTQTYHSHGVSSTTRVRVLKGAVSCKTARKVFRDLVAGKGTHHEKPGQGMAAVTVTVDGWTCGYFAGGEACNRGPTKHPTAQIRQINASVPGS